MQGGGTGGEEDAVEALGSEDGGTVFLLVESADADDNGTGDDRPDDSEGFEFAGCVEVGHPREKRQSDHGQDQADDHPTGQPLAKEDAGHDGTEDNVGIGDEGGPSRSQFDDGQVENPDPDSPEDSAQDEQGIGQHMARPESAPLVEEAVEDGEPGQKAEGRNNPGIDGTKIADGTDEQGVPGEKDDGEKHQENGAPGGGRR